MMRTTLPGFGVGFALLLAFAWASEALAQDGRPLESDADVAHTQSDTNGDGGIDHSEFHSRMVEVFYFADGDRDGYLVGIEIVRTGRENPAAGDTNGDERVSLKEFIDEAFDRFEVGDVDDDEELSVEEVRAAYGK
ncbi:MAG: hypothetical protein AAEJ52_07765 [Myxococcota bacterium]